MAKTETLSAVNLRTVREQILDENKLVTYVSLSKDLCIHVNEAKVLLRQVVEEIKQRDTNTNINVTFIISGLSSEKSARTVVCTESDLQALKNTFQTVFFHHIYSVCVGSQCIDNAAFVTINKLEDFPLCAGLIKGDTCIKRSSDEIGSLKSNSQPAVDESKPSVSKKESKDSSKVNLQNGHQDNKNVVKVHETKSEPIVKTEVISPKKDSTSLPNGKHNVKNGTKATKGIAGFFTKSNSAPSKKTTKIAQEIVKEITIKKESEPEVKESMDIDEEEIVVTDIKKEPQSRGKVNNKKNNTLNQIKKNAKVDKKRKRVLHVSDSESEGENDPFAEEQVANHDSEDEIPPTPSNNTIKITSGILNPKKRRKVVDRTYTDEEGYILTRKEEIYVSCSEDEADLVDSKPNEKQPEKENIKHTFKIKTEVSPKEKAKSTKKKVTPPQKGKQGNIMNFFKKV